MAKSESPREFRLYCRVRNDGHKNARVYRNNLLSRQSDARERVRLECLASRLASMRDIRFPRLFYRRGRRRVGIRNGRPTIFARSFIAAAGVYERCYERLAERQYRVFFFLLSLVWNV